MAVGIEFPKRRFGVIAIEKGFITTNELWEALLRQKGQEVREEEITQIGMLLKDLNYLSAAQMNEVLDVMKEEKEVVIPS